MKPTKANITGVETFDHSSLKRLPEYHKARKALDDLVHAINEHEAMPGSGTYQKGQVVWLKVVEQMATSLPYADSSGHHDGNPNYRNCPLNTDDYLALWFPYRIVAENGWCSCWYRCQECNHEWTCGYAVNIPEFI